MLKKNVTSYRDINKIIVSMAQGISKIFNKNLIGIYLFGSLTYGDFNKESSDVDMVTILKNPVTESEFKELKELHKQIEKSSPDWAKRIENSYTPQSMLTSIMPPGSRPYYGEGVFYSQAQYGNEWIINLYLLYNYGKAIVGPEFGELVQPIKIQDVQQACVRDLFKEWEPKLRELEWLDNSHYQSYLVMNLCRILNTVMNATTLSKKKSAVWVKQEYPKWKELIQTAGDWHFGTEMKQKDKTLEFLKFVIKEVNYKAP
jgi:predicted nucleotidyltransferase